MLYERAGSIERLAGAAEDVARGGGQVVLVRGEAGIGKTSLVRAALDESGVKALIGRCDDTSVRPLLGPFRDIFDQAGVVLDTTQSDVARERLGAVMQTTDCLVIEDLHWADEATYDFVSHIGRRIAEVQILLVLTTRPSDDPHLARCLAQLPADQLVNLELEPLSRETVKAMAAAAGRPHDEVYEQSRGNPFLVSEILASPPGVVPRRVADSTLARMATLSDEAKGMAALLSVFPAGASWDVLSRIQPDEMGALDDLERAGWLEASGDRITFRHELLRLAVEETLSTMQRRRLNRQALDVLSTSQADVAALAHHAERAGETRQFLENTILAAREYASAGAHRDAMTHLLRVQSHAPLLSDVERARFNEALGSELMTGDRSAEGRDALQRALQGWEDLGDLDSQARVMAQISTATWQSGDVDRSLAELQDALDLMADSADRSLVVRTRVNLAQAIGMLSRWHEALTTVEEAMEEALVVGGEALAMALGVRGNARRILGDANGGLSDQNASIDVALRSADQSWAMTGYINRAAASLGTLDLGGIDGQLHEAMAYSRSTQAEAGRARLEGHSSYLLMLRGEWNQALELSRRRNSADVDPFWLIRTQLVEGLIRVRRGEDSAVALIRKAHGQARSTNDIQRLGDAVAALAELHWLGKADAGMELVDRAEVARASGHVRHAAELSLWCRRLGFDVADTPMHGPAPLLAELDGDWATAASGWEQLGLPFYRILTLAFSDDEAAMREAVVEATRLGAPATADRVRSRLREHGYRVSRGPTSATLTNPAGLTRRQIEVAGLLAEGLSNREIADRLFISPKTVDHHVSAVLTRLGVDDRHEAGQWAIAQGLADSP